MNTHRIDRQTDRLGIVWFVVPLMWAAVALIGCALVAHWPGLFAEELPAPAGATATATAPAAVDAATAKDTP
ncbi:MAG TPA: hypothetical protein VKP68_07525 [Ramlibacter sp.]|nr:hypothetical protein [Ramlibacter sp.]